jgi:hypothetical protein
MVDSAFKLCPFCKEQIRQEAIKCRFCGEWLESKPGESQRDTPHKSPAESVLPPPSPPQERIEPNSTKADKSIRTPSRIEITVTHSSFAFVYRLFTPTITINGNKERRPWGVHSFDLTPGDYDVAVSYPWLFSPECGKNSIRVSLAPGEIKKVHYCAGPIRYVPGKITLNAAVDKESREYSEPQEDAEANSMKAVAPALDRMDQQRPTSPPKQSKPTPAISPTRSKISWPLVIGTLLMFAGMHHNTNEPPSNNPMDLPVRLGFTAAGLWMWVNYWVTRKKWSKWISLAFAMLLASGVIYLGFRIQSNVERNKRFGDVLRGFTDEAEKSMKNGTLPNLNPPRDKALDLESRLFTDMAQAMLSVMGRMNEELDSVGEKPVYDASVLSSKTTLKEEINKRIESYHIVHKWQPQLLSLVSDAMKKKVDSYNDPDKEKIIRGMEQGLSNQRPMFERMFNLLEKKETAEQAFLSFMASSDYQFNDGKVFSRNGTATQSEQYNALAQRVEDSHKEIETFRKQRLDEMKKSAAKFGH